MRDRTPTPGGPFLWTLAFLTWLGFALVAVGGGIFRVVWLEPRLGEYAANVVETLGLVVVLAGTIWIAVPWLVPQLRREDVRKLGLFWFVLTIAFEFLFGHYVDGASWSALLANYDITAGRFWILVPLTMGIGPSLVRLLKAQSFQARQPTGRA